MNRANCCGVAPSRDDVFNRYRLPPILRNKCIMADCKMIIIIFFLCDITFAESSESPEEIITKTDSGYVQGHTAEYMGRRIISYRGIPYAEPPVGPLRFKKPSPVSSWLGVRNTLNKPPACVQFASPTAFKSVNINETSEDCLYLHIWAPANKSDRPRTTMIYIHGGGLVAGTINDDQFEGGVLAAFGDVIIVVVAYRLGALGFLNLDNSDCSGNMGLYDQHEAIKWVHRNIENFGGSPSRITLFGESAGAQSVAHHILSPLNIRLFNRVIIQSGGTPVTLPSENGQVALHHANNISLRVGCGTANESDSSSAKQVLLCLKTKNAVDIMRAEADTFLRSNTRTTFRVHDSFIPQPIPKLLQDSRVLPVDMLAGVMAFEGGIQCYVSDSNIFRADHPAELSKKQAEDYLRANFLNLLPENVSNAVLSLYFKSIKNDSSDFALIRNTTCSVIADIRIQCPTYYISEASSVNNSVYFYRFGYRPSWTKYGAWMGATHGMDLIFVFGTPFRDYGHFTELDRERSRIVMTAWTNFAKYGKPAVSQNKQWPLFNSVSQKFIHLNPVRLEVLHGLPRYEYCQFLKLFDV